MKEFYITDDGIKLHAKLDMPENYAEGTKCPLAIVIHGLTGHWTSLLIYIYAVILRAELQQ